MQPLGIAEFELTGAISGLTLAAEIAPGRNVLLCCDDNASRGVLIRGHSRTRRGRGVASVFRPIAASAGARAWLEFAPTDLNSADDLSRTRE